MRRARQQAGLFAAWPIVVKQMSVSVSEAGFASAFASESQRHGDGFLEVDSTESTRMRRACGPAGQRQWSRIVAE